MSELKRTLTNRSRQAEVARHLRALPTFVVAERIPVTLHEKLQRLDAAEVAMRQGCGNAR